MGTFCLETLSCFKLITQENKTQLLRGQKKIVVIA